MRVAEHPEWVGAIVLDDGSTFYFCSVRCTLGACLRSAEVLRAEPSRIRQVRVPDYLAGNRWVDADTALFVTGSDVVGPMGWELVPAASKEDAEVIVRRHGGRVLRRSDVTIDVLRELKGRGAPP